MFPDRRKSNLPFPPALDRRRGLPRTVRIVVDAEGICVRATGPCLRMTGWCDEDLRDRKMSSFLDRLHHDPSDPAEPGVRARILGSDGHWHCLWVVEESTPDGGMVIMVAPREPDADERNLAAGVSHAA